MYLSELLAEIDELIDKLLNEKPELTRDLITEQIRQKKEKIGNGYLTDQGAVFLIASDHGVRISGPQKTEISIKELYSGAKDISLETRVLNFSPAKQFSRKKDGSSFYLRTMTVYDANSAASVKLWDEKAKLDSVENLKPGDLIKIIKAYVKSDFNGAPTIHIGSGSDIETVNTKSEIPTIDTITKDVSEAKEGEKNMAVSGIIDGIISEREFTNSRGMPSTMLKMRLRGTDGSRTSVVLWGKDESNIPNVISDSAKVRLLGVRTRLANQTIEIHGDDATIVEIEGNKDIEPVIVRVLSISTENDKNMLLAVDGKKNLVHISDYADSTKICTEGDIIECMPSKIRGNSITLDEGSFVRKLDNDESIPLLSQVRTKINDVKIDTNYCIEAIVLKAPERRDIQTKSGETVALSEMFVEDDSGQIWIKGWRNQARILDKWQAGEIITITGLDSRAGLEGRTELFITPFSKIAKKT